jgi:hypothetical protein
MTIHEGQYMLAGQPAEVSPDRTEEPTGVAPWEGRAAEKRRALLDSIPQEWVIPAA